jgi:hypothetical protein
VISEIPEGRYDISVKYNDLSYLEHGALIWEQGRIVTVQWYSPPPAPEGTGFVRVTVTLDGRQEEAQIVVRTKPDYDIIMTDYYYPPNPTVLELPVGEYRVWGKIKITPQRTVADYVDVVVNRDMTYDITIQLESPPALPNLMMNIFLLESGAVNWMSVLFMIGVIILIGNYAGKKKR